MNEKLVIVPKRRTVGKKIFDVALFAVTCVFIILAMVVPVFFIVPVKNRWNAVVLFVISFGH